MSKPRSLFLEKQNVQQIFNNVNTLMNLYNITSSAKNLLLLDKVNENLLSSYQELSDLTCLQNPDPRSTKRQKK